MARKLFCTGAIILVVALFAGSAWSLLSPSWVYQVYIDDRPVGMVKSLEEYAQVIKDIQTNAEEHWDCELLMNEEVSVSKVSMWSPQLSAASVRAGIEAAATYQTRGWAIVVNGDIAAIVDREQTARDILAAVKAQYLSKEKNYTLVSIDFQEAITIESMVTTPEVLMDEEMVMALLVCGQEELRTYVVKPGDTLLGISRSNNVSTALLRSANSIDGDFLQAGQVLQMQVSKALLHVKTVEEIALSETIIRPVKYKTNPDKSVRDDRVIETGADGRRDVIYKVVKINGNEISRSRINTVITKQPQAKVILTGIGYWPAKPTGMFRFPLNKGKITDWFGTPRRFCPHQGIDIGAPRGTPIYAAADGIITTRTRGSSYGKYIVIQHANGYSTLYAHMTEFADYLRVGSSVSRGQVIGYVGSTGYSTGSHLHWEIRCNGEHLNPLRFFSN
jgi:murein DD-endopeptidase MepM/ murein hydrolase activator NlpD